MTKIICTSALVLLIFIPLSLGATFPQAVINEMATRKNRYYHYLWHQVREGWNRFSDSTKDAFRQIGWACPRPARSYDSSGTASGIYDNDSGEDFLYMHRTMINMANSIITRIQDPMGRVTGWTTIPGPGDTNYPVPHTYSASSSSMTSTITSQKTDSFYYNSIAQYEKMFKDPAQLRQMTLGELGARIEMTMHSWLHLRFSGTNPVGFRDGYRGTIPNVDRMYDNVNYNWLADSYSSHVNPIFWKLHGWVDDRIEDWRKANNLTSIRWKGTWTGGPMSNLGGVLKTMDMDMMHSETEEDSDGNIELMEQAFQIFKESGVPEASFADPVKIDWTWKEEGNIRKSKTY